MFKLSRLRSYLLIYVILLSGFALTDFWTHLDYAVYKAIYIDDSKEVSLLEKTTLVDIPYYKNKEDAKNERVDIGNLRKRLVDLLRVINSRADNASKPEVPEVVIIDFYFPYEAVTDSIEIENLKNAISDLKANEIKVFGVYNVDKFYDDEGIKTFLDLDKKHAVEIYDNFTNQDRLHAVIENKSGILYYKSVYNIPREKGEDGVVRGTQHIEALPLKVAHAIDPKPRPQTEEKIFMLLIGDSSDLTEQTFNFTHESGSTTGGKFLKDINFHDKYLIIGSSQGDDTKGIDGITSQYGSQLLAWALNDQISPEPDLIKYPLDNSLIQVGMVLLFALFVVIAFGFMFKFFRKLQTKPWLLALFSFLTGTIILLIFGYTYWALDRIIPLGLTMISMGTAAVLSWRFCNKFLVTKIAEGNDTYDVFISYSFDHNEWVKENVYQPLLEFRKSDGKKLNIFFAEKSIAVGAAFTSKYMWDIVNSKTFVPIFTEDYYGKNHCKNEMDLAYFRMIENSSFIKIYPIAQKFEYIPEIYKPRLTNVIEGKDDFIQDLLKILNNEN